MKSSMRNIFIVTTIIVLCLDSQSGSYANSQDKPSEAQAPVSHPWNSDAVGRIKDGIRHVTPREAATLLKIEPSIRVLDVRTRGEFNAGHIKGATQINYLSGRFKRKIKALDTQSTWLVHCKSGHRSGRAVGLMQKAGFSKIIHMDGGFDGWKKAKLPISKGQL